MTKEIKQHSSVLQMHRILNPAIPLLGTDATSVHVHTHTHTQTSNTHRRIHHCILQQGSEGRCSEWA